MLNWLTDVIYDAGYIQHVGPDFTQVAFGDGNMSSSEEVDGCLLARKGLCINGNPPLGLHC